MRIVADYAFMHFQYCNYSSKIAYRKNLINLKAVLLKSSSKTDNHLDLLFVIKSKYPLIGFCFLAFQVV